MSELTLLAMRHGAPPAADKLTVLGVPISKVTMPAVINLVGRWISRGEARQISTCDVHCLMRAQTDARLAEALQNADVVVPDGKPVAWTVRVRFGPGIERVCGPDLMLALCERSAQTGWRHYFYGGADGVAEALAEELQLRYPGLEVAGTECPPFRRQTAAEIAGTRQRILQSRADIVWVGLGCPKQDVWMLENASSLPGVVSIGVGAAFDFHTGRIARAPVWMQRNGLEWFHRLASEPRRLWPRYLVLAPRFVLATLPGTLVMGARRAMRRKG
jgi:N-acetylglucosaminyldiphosphoundecaprenol N-acetyl-beta-D-mannosaminyltransferase